MKCSSETLQNLPYFWNTKRTYFFPFSFHATFMHSLSNFNDINQGIQIKLYEMKTKTKNYVDFEAFHRKISSRHKPLISEEWLYILLHFKLSYWDYPLNSSSKTQCFYGINAAKWALNFFFQLCHRGWWRTPDFFTTFNERSLVKSYFAAKTC